MTDTPTDTVATGTTCPTCGEAVGETDQFCESCGAPLREPGDMVAVEPLVAAQSGPAPGSPLPRACSCGGAIDPDGYCTTCGIRAPSERDHFGEQPAPNVAFVSDKGVVHARNEDGAAVGVAADHIVLVVCDGVSNAFDSDIASLAAAGAARDVLAAATERESSSPAAVVEHWTEVHQRAAAAAQREAAATAAGAPTGENPPSCTYVAAVIDGPVLVAAWIGDSRCYWLPDVGPAIQVSIDDSWATVRINQGTPREVAEAEPRAHAITRWLGIDGPGGEPSTTSIALEGPGWVLVCSDGLWNYCSPAPNVRALVEEHVAAVGDDPLELSAALCQWANAQGGHDNVTVALARVSGDVEPDPDPSPRSA